MSARLHRVRHGEGSSEAAVAQAVKVAAEAQAQKDTIKHQQDTQASLSADVTRLKDEAAKVAEAKVRAEKEAAAKAAEVRVAAAKAATAQAARTSCNGNVSVGGNTTCAFAVNVESSYYQAVVGTQRSGCTARSPASPTR